MPKDSPRFAYYPLLSTKEAAQWSGNSERWILQQARAGLLGKQINGVWYFSQEQLAEFFGVPLRQR